MTPPPPPSRVTAAELPALRRRTSAVLIVSQILGGLGVAVGIAPAPMLATEVSGSEALSGLAPTASVAGTALLSLPLAALMASRGRRPGLVLAYVIGALGGALVVLGTAERSFPVLLVGMAAFGAGSSANLQARFAAADLVGPERRGRAISHVVWATTIGSVLGPNIAAPVNRLFRGTPVPENAGPYLCSAVVFLLAGLVVAILLRPDPLLTARALAAHGDEGRGRRSLRDGVAAVRASPRARLALVTVTISHTAMVSIMVMTPVDLGRHGADLQLIGLVISGHIGGMYAFSPVMGWLADRFGRLSVIGLAVGLLGVAALLAGTAGPRHGQTAAGLFVLGLGWSAGMIAGSALLTDSVPQAARAAVQGLSDLTMNAAAGLGGAAAGVVVAQWGYGPLNATAAALLLPVAALALRRSLRPSGGAGAATSGAGPATGGAASPETEGPPAPAAAEWEAAAGKRKADRP
ncbi:Major Facilitator Superfamily protein [Streptomyces sp. ADI96-02]|nr:Major Facilitator Superfamily protein [Streptomyces sp. ADI96-02]